MWQLSRRIRSIIVYAVMMPGALWAGVQAPECECASGEHRFFCPMMIGAPRSISSKTLAAHGIEPRRSCCTRLSPSSTPLRSCCASKAISSASSTLNVSSPQSCGQCRAIPHQPPVLGDRVDAPSLQQEASLQLSNASDQVSLAQRFANSYRTPPSDRLPKTDRVIVLCCLLI